MATLHTLTLLQTEVYVLIRTAWTASVGRLGVSLGKDIESGNVYVRASYLYDFDGDAKMHMNYGDISTPFSEDLGGGWWEFGVGTNLNLGHDTHFYADLEKTTGGDVTTPWQWNAGFRFSF